jgi:polysaccharide export outer membrane protein
MHLQKWGRGNRAILLMTLLVLLGSWVGAASGQSSTNSATVAKPVLPDSAEPAKSGQPAAPDTTPPRVADVHPDSFIIGTEDILNINVWKENELSRVVPVRPDGMITLPLIGEIKATGLTPIQLQEQISTLLKKFMADPQVTVIVVEVHSLTFNVVGLVLKPGYYPLTRRMTVLDAIALSGGFQPFAKQKKVYVLRTSADGKQERLKFNYKEVIKGKRPDENIVLQPRDTVVIP